MKKITDNIITAGFFIVVIGLIIGVRAFIAYIHNDWRCAFTECRILTK